MLCLERTSGLSDESILRWKQPIDAAAGFDRFEAILREVLHLGPPEADLPLHDTPPADAGDFPGGAGRQWCRSRPPTIPGMNWTHWTS